MRLYCDIVKSFQRHCEKVSWQLFSIVKIFAKMLSGGYIALLLKGHMVNILRYRCGGAIVSLVEFASAIL